MSFLAKVHTELTLFWRRLQVYTTGIRIYITIKATQFAIKRSKNSSNPPDQATIDARWSATHRLCAERFLALSLRLCGLWIKCSQYAASRSDVLPPEYEEVLSVALDSVPKKPHHLVRSMVESELGKRIEDVFSVFEDEPLATASIATVVRATVRETGQDVVVKVQHHSIERIVMQDLINLERIIKFVAGREPEFDFRPVMQAWIDVVPCEMDFVHEMKNMKRVTEGFANAPAHLETKATLPVPVQELTTKRVLVMSYVDGCKISDLETFDKYNVDREAVITEITKAYGLQMLAAKGSPINGDPHSGNILVNRLDKGGHPVLLDFGLCVELDDNARLGFSRLVLAASDNDSYSLLRSFTDMGIELNREDPEESLEMVHFLFRSTASREQNVDDAKNFNKHMEKSFKEKHGITDNSESKRQKKRKKGKGPRRNPVDAFPGYLVFLFRSLSMLRGLCTFLGVKHAYLPVLINYAKHALYISCPAPQRSVATVLPPTSTVKESTRIRRAVARVFQELGKRDLFLGAQVAVYHHNELMLDLAAGRMGEYNPRPVRNDSLFPSFSTTKGPLSILAAAICDRHNIQYTDLVKQYWASYGKNGKEYTTVSQLLSHRAGLANAIPTGLTMKRLRNDWAGIIKHLEESKPAHVPGEKAEYHYLTFGWLIAEFIRQAGGKTFSNELTLLAEKLGIEDECYCGNMPDDLLNNAPESRVASLRNNMFAAYQTYAKSRQGRDGDENLERGESSASLDHMYDSTAVTPKKIISEMTNHVQNPEMNALTEIVERLPTFLLDPTFMSHPELRAACIPAANGHFSARALARIFAMLANDGEIDGVRILKPGRAKEMMKCLWESDKDESSMQNVEGVGWGAGLRLFDIDRGKKGVAQAAGAGHGGLGGSIAFCIPEEEFAMAVTVNKLELVNPAVIGAVLAACKAARVGVPSYYINIQKHIKKGKAFDIAQFVQENQAQIMTG